MRTIVTIWALMALASVSSAAPVLTWDMEDVGDLDGFTVSVSDDQSASWAVNIDFWGCPGELVQYLAFGALDIDWEEDARLHDALDCTYRSYLDSWVCEGWEVLPTGISGRPHEPYHIHVGTPPGEAFGVKRLAYLVVDEGNGICWNGVVTRLGVDYPVSGWIPEPAASGLLALGAMGLSWRKRRARHPRQ
jgi:PEP-CTERM motif-containing protein